MRIKYMYIYIHMYIFISIYSMKRKGEIVQKRRKGNREPVALRSVNLVKLIIDLYFSFSMRASAAIAVFVNKNTRGKSVRRGLDNGSSPSGDIVAHKMELISMLMKTWGESRKCQSEERRARIIANRYRWTLTFVRFHQTLDRFRSSVEENSFWPSRKENSRSANCIRKLIVNLVFLLVFNRIMFKLLEIKFVTMKKVILSLYAHILDIYIYIGGAFLSLHVFVA